MQSGLPCIALGAFVRAVAQKSYDDFGILKDQLQNDIPRAKRDKVLEFLPMARHKLIRFLVLVRYLRQNHSRIKALEKIHEIIIKSEHQYFTACRNFDALYTEMVTTCEPSWDVESALHILTLGSYRNLPQIIDKSLMNAAKHRLSPTFISSTIHKLNNALRVRLLSDRIPPELNLINIKQGMVYMIAKHQFKIAISLRMRPKLVDDEKRNRHENERVRWSLFELKLLLKASTKTQEAQFIVNDIERNALLLVVNNKMKLSKHPLQTMYKELNTFCGKLQFAVLNQQIYCIRYQYNESNIRIERESEKFITVRMWKHAAILPPDSCNIGDIHNNNNNNKGFNDEEEPSKIHMLQKELKQKQVQQQQQWQQLQSKTNNSKKTKSMLGSSYFNTNTNTQHFNMDGLDEFERKENEIKSQFRIWLSIFYEEQGLNIKYHPRFPSFATDEDDDDNDEKEDDYKHLLSVNPNHLNLPQLVENFTILHSNYRLLYILNKLIEIDKEYKIAPKVKACKAESDAKYVLFSSQDTDGNMRQKQKLDIMKSLDTKCIEICLFDGKYVEIYVDCNNGRILFEKAYHEFVSTAPLIFEKHLKMYNDEINKDLSKVSWIISNLKVDCLLENIIDLIHNELKLKVVSYSTCNKPNKYFVYPSLLLHNRHILQLKKRKKNKNVTIKEENDEYKVYHSHIMQTYTEILNSWNENNSVFIQIPQFGNHCYLVIFYRSQSNAETYCVVNDHYGNVLYIHNIILDEKAQYDAQRGMIQISSDLIIKWMQYCVKILPQHLIRIMISLHTQSTITDLKWNINKAELKRIQFDILFPHTSTTANFMHLLPMKFEFEISFEKYRNKKNKELFAWKCVVKQDEIFTNHKTSLLQTVNKTFKVKANTLCFEYKNTLNISEFTRICNYCYKLLVVHNLLKNFIDHKQTIKQQSAFYRNTFYELKRIDLVAPITRIEIEFSVLSARKYVMYIDIVWNNVDHVEYYTDARFNPYIHNTDYKLNISFSDSNIFEWIPNLKGLIKYYFAYRQKYHKKLHKLLRRHYTDDEERFDSHEAMLKFKDCGKHQTYLFIQYESLSLMMFLQKLYWTIKTLNHLNPFIDCMNNMHRWFYPQLEPFIQTKVTQHDTLRIISSFYSAPTDNILALRILNENKVCLHEMDCFNGWQLTLKEVEFTNVSRHLLKHIQNHVLLPQKQRLFCKVFHHNKSIKINNHFIDISLQNIMFSSIKYAIHRQHKNDSNSMINQVLSLLHFRKDDENICKLGLKQKANNNNASEAQQPQQAQITLYDFQKVIGRYINNTHAAAQKTIDESALEFASNHTIDFIDDVMKAYFYLYCDMNAAYPLYHELKVQSFLSVLFSSFIHFLRENTTARQNNANVTKQVPPIAKALLSIQELFALYYDEMLQLSIFGGKIHEIVGRNYFLKTNLKQFGSVWELTNDNVFWYNLHHINDNDIIYDRNALCVAIHLAEICGKQANKASLHLYASYDDCDKVASPSATVALSPTTNSMHPPSRSPSLSPSSKRGRRRRKRGGKYNRNGYHQMHHDTNGKIKVNQDEIWMFEKYELQNHLLLNIAVDFKEGNIFFYQNYQRRNNKYRKISISFLPDLHKLVESINFELKQNGVLGTLIASFLRQFVRKLSQIKSTNQHKFDQIWKQLKRLNN